MMYVIVKGQQAIKSEFLMIKKIAMAIVRFRLIYILYANEVKCKQRQQRFPYR